MKSRVNSRHSGMTLIGLIFVLAIVGLIAVLAMKITPTVVEYQSIKKAIVTAKAASTNPSEIRASFDKQADVGYIDSIKGKDLEISKNGDDVEVSFSYEKKIPLVGPASLLLEYEGTTATDGIARKPQMASQ
jgi:type II secretory pathway pseudopilin PulG